MEQETGSRAIFVHERTWVHDSVLLCSKLNWEGDKHLDTEGTAKERPTQTGPGIVWGLWAVQRLFGVLVDLMILWPRSSVFLPLWWPPWLPFFNDWANYWNWDVFSGCQLISLSGPDLSCQFPALSRSPFIDQCLSSTPELLVVIGTARLPVLNFCLLRLNPCSKQQRERNKTIYWSLIRLWFLSPHSTPPRRNQ